MDTALARVRGEPLDIVEAEPLDEEDGASAPPVAGTPLDWDLPPAPPPAPARAAPRAPPPPPPAQSPRPASAPLDDLLGVKPGASRTPPPPPPADADGADGKPRVPVVLFGGAAQGSRPSVQLTPTPQFSDDDLAILDDIERMSQGQDATLDTEKVKPARMVASLIRLLIRKGVIQESEFLEELARK
jgi:hypothetical protein